MYWVRKADDRELGRKTWELEDYSATFGKAHLRFLGAR